MKSYLGCLINMAKAIFFPDGKDKTKLFFTCLDLPASTESSVWYAALKGRIDRISFERALLAGENMDSNAPP